MFESHKLNDRGFKQMLEFKNEFALAVKRALDLMPDGREKAIFMTKIEEAVFFGAKAIAGKDGNFSEIVDF